MPESEHLQLLESTGRASALSTVSINFGCRLDKWSLVGGIDLLAQSLRRDAE